MRSDIDKMVRATQLLRDAAISIGKEYWRCLSSKTPDKQFITCPKCEGARSYPRIGNIHEGGREVSQWVRCSLCHGMGVVIASDATVAKLAKE